MGADLFTAGHTHVDVFLGVRCVIRQSADHRAYHVRVHTFNSLNRKKYKEMRKHLILAKNDRFVLN